MMVVEQDHIVRGTSPAVGWTILAAEAHPSCGNVQHGALRLMIESRVRRKSGVLRSGFVGMLGQRFDNYGMQDHEYTFPLSTRA